MVAAGIWNTIGLGTESACFVFGFLCDAPVSKQLALSSGNLAGNPVGTRMTHCYSVSRCILRR